MQAPLGGTFQFLESDFIKGQEKNKELEHSGDKGSVRHIGLKYPHY